MSLQQIPAMPANKHIPRVHIVGRKNAGKTTLVCDLVTELTRQGYRVATIKHTHHHHELDTPDKDSHKHREVGAAVVCILSSQMTAAFVPVHRHEEEAVRYARYNLMFSDCDIILVEGDQHTTAMKLEVWRSVVGEVPYAAADLSIVGVVSDDPVAAKCELLKRSDLPELARWIIANAPIETPSRAPVSEPVSDDGLFRQP